MTNLGGERTQSRAPEQTANLAKGRRRGAPPPSQSSEGAGEVGHYHTLVRVNAE